MGHYKNYIKLIKADEPESLYTAINKTVDEIVSNHIKAFDFSSHKTGLLLGNIQSGKTGHMLGVVAAVADNEFEIFIVMTSDNTHLQEQTLTRTLQSLDTFCVCDETDELRFMANDMRKPVVIVLKKNTRVLESWKNNLISSKFLVGRSIFIVDDEGDAASLNIKINQNDISAINQKISDIRKLANSSFYLQVTATPQSLFLQSKETDYRPQFVYYFRPGEGYLGGNFFYNTSEPYGEKKVPRSICTTEEEELKELIEEESYIPDGMLKAIASFLISAAHLFKVSNKESCNFLVHPSVRISDHEKIVEKIGNVLNDLLLGTRDDVLTKEILKNAWLDLQDTKPDLLDFDDCFDFVENILEEERINIIPMNSRASSSKLKFDKGINIIVGGNAVGRGVTFPNLITTYYCRKSKKPQADTYWQHCRAFGYDRDPLLVRIFLPTSLFKLFSELNNANNAMIEYIEEYGVDEIKLIYPNNINPTRKAAVNKDKLEIIAGGVNHFPSFPSNKNTAKLNSLLCNFGENEFDEVDNISFVKDIITSCSSEYQKDWPNNTYINCIDSLQNKNFKTAILIVRRDRSITKNTGTLLSPNDRALGEKFKDKIVLTLYQVDGDVKKGWSGKPLWIPNIKFPKGYFFYGVNS